MKLWMTGSLAVAVLAGVLYYANEMDKERVANECSIDEDNGPNTTSSTHVSKSGTSIKESNSSKADHSRMSPAMIDIDDSLSDMRGKIAQEMKQANDRLKSLREGEEKLDAAIEQADKVTDTLNAQLGIDTESIKQQVDTDLEAPLPNDAPPELKEELHNTDKEIIELEKLMDELELEQ